MHYNRRIDPHAPCEPLPEPDLRAFLAASLADGRAADDVEIVDRAVQKRRSDWRGARLFESVTICSAAGEPLSLFLKYRRSYPDPAVPVMPVDREPRVYQDLLQHGPHGPPKFYGAGSFDADGTSLLLLEYVDGQRLKKLCRQETWEKVVSWLARMHVHFLPRSDEVRRFVPVCDADFYWSWAHRAAETVFASSAKNGSGMERVLSHYGNVARLLTGTPRTLLHGEFYCTNVMVDGDPQRLRVCAFDWETAALGCGALDLACLLRQTCGLNEADLVCAYRTAWLAAGGPELTIADLEAQISAARAHELMCRLWNRMRPAALPAERIQTYSDRVLTCIARTGTTMV
jgi:hypothetical protein